MSSIQGVKDKLLALISSANAVTGKEDTDLSSAQASLVDGYNPVKGGYSVTFIDENNEVIAFMSVKAGSAIYSPDYDTETRFWKDKDELYVSFPYTPTADAKLYAEPF